MPHRGRLRLPVIAILIALAGAAPAVGSPQDVLADYQADGSIDQEHSIADLQGALVEVQDTSLYGAFRDAVQIELNEKIGGVRPSGGGASPPPTATTAGTPAAGGDSTGTRTAPTRTAPPPDTPGQGSGGGTRTATEATPQAAAGGGGGSDDDPPLVPRSRTRPDAATPTADPDDTADATARDISGLSAGRELPQPPTVAPGDEVPFVFVGLSLLAALLLVAGLVSAVYRRTSMNRRP